MWRLSEDTIATNWPNNRVSVLAKRFADVANQAFEIRSASFIATLDLIMEEIVGIATPAATEVKALILARDLLNAAAHRMITPRFAPPEIELPHDWHDRLQDEFRNCAQLFLMATESFWHSLNNTSHED